MTTPGSTSTAEVPVVSPLRADKGGLSPRHRRRWVAGGVVAALVVAGAVVGVTNPFATKTPAKAGVVDNADPTSLYTVARQDLSSQTQVSATLGYAGSYTIAAPSGASGSLIAQAQQTVTEDRQTLSADEQTKSDKSSADKKAITADQTNVNAAVAALSLDEAKQAQDCTGSGSASAACSQDDQKVSQDQTQLTQAGQLLASARSAATLDRDQNQAKVISDETKLQGDQATLASLQVTVVNPGTTYTELPSVGEIIKEDQPVYSLSNEAVPLLYGSIPASRAFYVGMSNGPDVSELIHDLVALGYGAGLAQSNHYSSATAASVARWQSALGLPATGEILLGQAMFEPGPIRVTSVTPSLGVSIGSGGGGGSVLTATSTTRQVSIALDASQQSEVAVGDKVTITLPNNQTTPGVISSVGTVATAPASGSSNSSPTITVLVNPTDPAATGTWDQAPVNVTITTGTVTNVPVVPVDALLAQSGGGHAVEVVGTDGIHHLVPVTLGLSDDADGLVQVSGSGLATGQRVVVPNL